MSRKIQFASFLLLLTLVSIAAQSSFAQADPPLNFGANYFVTGDYVVAGAQGLNASMGSDGLGTGIISFPDGNPGIRGANANMVPKGANIVAAFLYWETVEKVINPGTGQNGFFGPVINGTAQLYPISGFNVPSHDAVSFSNGGCSGTSTGKIVKTYRTDVRGYLPLDANGNVLVDKADGVTFEVRLPNVGNNTPLTLGATLVLIYRVISPNVPLNVITIYDGAFAPNTTPNFTMSQTVQGFYQAAASPVSRLTHIVGAGKSNKFQAAFLSGSGPLGARAAVQLPSPYGNGQPAFPGHYVNWDNTTWMFPDTNFPNVGNLANPLQENDDTANVKVVASGANPGCVSWGATIVSTTVHDDDKDGILQVWKQHSGYTDVATGLPVDLTGATIGHQDVFIQFDHVVDSNGDFTPDLINVVSPVTSAFQAHGVYLHITDASQTTGIAGANAVQEPAVTDLSPSCAPKLCPYPNQVGITTWRDGVELVKNQPVNLNYTEAECEANSPPLAPIGPLNCKRRFPPQLRNSHHYALWGDTLGGPNWTFLGGRLTDHTGTGAGVVAQSGSTVTFYTTRGHGLTVDANAGNGRVTIANAITNPNLNGTFLVTSFTCPTNPDTGTLDDCSTNNRALGPYIFTISIGGSASMAKYTLQTDPYLSVASGQAGAGSGFSDVGGGDTLITLFQWGSNATLSAKKGTLLHELGHTLGLLHGGGDNTNCKPNYQSVMNYMFQAHLLGPGAVLDLSNQLLNKLDETSLGPITTSDMSDIAIPYTKWYDIKPTVPSVPIAASPNGATESGFVVTITTTLPHGLVVGQSVIISGVGGGASPYNGTFTVVSVVTPMQFTYNASVSGQSPSGGGTALKNTAATAHCDGTPLSINDPPTYKGAGGTTLIRPSELDIPWSAAALASGVDANFEGNPPGNEPHPFNGYDDWANADYRQVGAGGNAYFSVPGGFVPGGPGGFVPGGPGISGGGGKVELDFSTAVSAIDPPSGLKAFEEVSPRKIDLSWKGITFPVINQYNVYRSSDGGATFSFLTSVTGTPPPTMFTDTVTCNPINGYQYFVTAVFNNTAHITSFSITSNKVTFQAANNFTAGTTVQISGMINGTYLNGQVLTVLSAGLTSTQFEASFTHANAASTMDSGTAVSSKESAGSNIVSTGQNGGLLTGCYAPAGFNLSSPANAVQGSLVPVQFTVLDDFNGTNSPVNTVDNPALVTLVANGPGLLINGCGPAVDTIIWTNGNPQNGVSTLASSGGQYTFNWATDLFCAGQYTVKLILDSHQMATTPALLQIDVTDTDSTNPHITTTAIPNGVVGFSYSNTISEHGGVTGANPFTWTLVNNSNPLPAGLSLATAPDGFSGLLSGIPSAAGMFSFIVQVKDSVGNIGTQTLTMTVTTPVAQINQPLVQDSSVPGAAAFVLTLNGTGFGPHSQVLWNGSPLLTTTFINNRQLTAAIPAPDVVALGTASVSVSNPVTINNQPVPNSNVDFFQITPTTSASLSRADSPSTGANPLGLIAADFNGDGKLDLATANNGDNTVSILLGNGDGTFTPKLPALIMTGANGVPWALAAGDFNHDGKIDLAVTDFANKTVSIFLGNGDGTFSGPVNYAVGSGPLQVLVGDFNRDGNLDLAVDNQNDQTFSILLGNGDGTFQAHHVDYAAGPDVAGVSLGDFNQDGMLDLVVANRSASAVSVLFGNGDGTFQAPVAYATGLQPINVGVADFNGDGILDLAVTNSDKTVSILLGNGDGTFKAQVTYPTTSGALGGSTAVATGDFNGDGKVDLAITNESDNSVSILLGNGDGTFQAPPLEFTTASGATGVAAGDFNGDGRLDVAVAGFAVSIMRQRPEPPTNLTTPNVTASQVTLNWTASTSKTVIGYNVYRGTLPGGESLLQSSVAGTTFTDTTVAAGTTYYYVVTAVDPGNLESVNSNEVSVTIPLPPTNLMTSNVTAAQVMLTWNASPTAGVVGFNGYNVYRGTTLGGPYPTKVNVAIVAASPFTDTTVASGTTYYYVVKAVGPNNVESVVSNEASATTPP